MHYNISHADNHQVIASLLYDSRRMPKPFQNKSPHNLPWPSSIIEQTKLPNLGSSSHSQSHHGQTNLPNKRLSAYHPTNPRRSERVE